MAIFEFVMRGHHFFVPKFHVVACILLKVSAQFEKKMAEEFQKYRDMLKREREEFQKQLVREIGTSWFLLFQ